MEDIIDIIVTETTNLIEITSQPTDEIIDVNIIDNREDVTLNVTPTVVEININSLTGNFGVNWGEITGTLSNQTDLQNALNLKADLVDGKVPSSQLPSYVDDVVEVANYASLPVTGEAGKIYVTIDTNYIYRWTGSVYVEIKDSSAVWGAITGTLSSQTDLQNALNAKDAILSFSSPLSRSTNTVSIPPATTSVNGFLTSTDWNTFNGKQAQLNGTGFVKASGTSISYDNSTYLTTASASSTYVPYTGANASVNLGNNNIEINGTTAYVRVQGGGASGFISESAGAKMQLSPTSLFLTEKQSSPNYTKTLDFRPTILGANYTIVVPDASGTIALTSQLHNAVTIGTANGLTLSTQVLSLGLASSTANGALSSTDWTTFNNKQNALTNPVTGTGTSGIVAVFNGTSSITDSTIYANSTRVSIGADVTTTNRFTAVSSTSSAYAVVAQASSAANGIWSNVLGTGEIFRGQTAGGSYFIINNGGNAFLNGNLNVGDFASTSYRLNVVGTANFTGALSGTSATFSGQLLSTMGNNSTIFNSTSATTGWQQIAINNTSGSTLLGVEGSAAGTLATGTNAYATILRNYTATDLQIATNNTVRLTIFSTGAATFSSSVTANKYVLNGTNGNSGQIIQQGDLLGTAATNFLIQSSTGNGLGFLVNGGTTFNMFINSSGNVGIGTTSPGAKLDIAGGDLYVRTGGALYANTLAPYSGNMTISLGGSGNNLIVSGGNVGIGTTSPGAIFTVDKTNTDYTNSSAAHILLNNSSTVGQSSIYYTINGTNRGKLRVDQVGNFNYVANGGDHTFWTNGDAGTGSVKLAILSGGQLVVGNGNTSVFSSTGRGSIEVNGSSNAIYGLLVGGVQKGYLYHEGTNVYVENSVGGGNFNIVQVGAGNITYTTNGSERMRITSGGDVLVGLTAIPATIGDTTGFVAKSTGTIHAVVSGDVSAVFSRKASDGSTILFRRDTTTVGSISVTTAMTSYNVTSDYRLKEDLKPINGLDIVNKIKVYDYKWKADNSRMDGVLAHELQEVLPYAVTGVKDGEQMQQVDYSKIVPVLIQSIKELKSKIETLENK